MKILLGIVIIHLVILFRAKFSSRDESPYISIFFLTVLLVSYVFYMLYTMPVPEP